MKKSIISIVLCLVGMLIFVGCAKYPEKNILGKTSAEIIEKYGAFDSPMLADEDGLYRNCTCWYIVKDAQVGFLGTSPEILFFMTFDENGTAISCKEDYRPGG